ncbi:hypothetical protein GCM10027589_04520 [Actinocorallia lasiicapitis]
MVVNVRDAQRRAVALLDHGRANGSGRSEAALIVDDPHKEFPETDPARVRRPHPEAHTRRIEGLRDFLGSGAGLKETAST